MIKAEKGNPYFLGEENISDFEILLKHIELTADIRMNTNFLKDTQEKARLLKYVFTSDEREQVLKRFDIGVIEKFKNVGINIVFREE